jgi:protease-4
MGDSYSQAQYFIAANADEVFLHEFGGIYMDGFGYFRAYFKEALEKLRIDVNVFRVGEYKSFVEPFTRNDMSAEDRASSRRWLDALWASYRRDIAAARELDPESLNTYANELADRVEARNGNLAEVAVEAGLVDGLLGRREFDAYMTDLVGEGEKEGQGFSAIGHSAYLRAIRQGGGPEQMANVGVIVATGQIMDGEGSPGTIGGDTLAALIGQAAADDAIDAVVLRVDSPGGSMFASEVVYEALGALKDTGKPLVASMGSVAASGGYYIAMPADEIWANATTITGSIGVGALLPTFQRSLGELGVHTDGFGTTALSGQADPARGLGPDARRILQASVEDAYRQFLQRVAASRDMSYERVDELARGRVWIGDDALELGLVDELGGLDDAVAAAAERAGLEPEDYGVRYIEQLPDFRQRLALRLIAISQRLVGWSGLRWPTASGGLARAVARLDGELQWLARFNDPRDLYYHCFCELR